MFFLETDSTVHIFLLGTLGFIILGVFIVLFVLFSRKRTIFFSKKIKTLEQEKQELYLMASIKFQEEERQRIAADLHDDAGPLLATVRLYLNDNLVNQEKHQQLQSITNAKLIIDDTIQLIRNISHSLMPPTLKNFGLESAVNDLYQKISGSGVIKASARFHDYRVRLSAEREMLAFRVIQELMNNIIKHSHAQFIHLTQNLSDNIVYIRLNHDGTGLTQADFDNLSFKGAGLGLKNIASRMAVLGGIIGFSLDASKTYYKITIEIPRDEP